LYGYNFIYEKCDEDYNTYRYTLDKLINNKFVASDIFYSSDGDEALLSIIFESNYKNYEML